MNEQIIDIRNNNVPAFEIQEQEEQQQQNTTQPGIQNENLQQNEQPDNMEQEQPAEEDFDLEELQIKENLLLQIQMYLDSYPDKLQSYQGKNYSGYSIEQLKKLVSILDYRVGVQTSAKAMLHGLYYTATSIAENASPSLLSGLTANAQNSEGIQSALQRIAISKAHLFYMSPIMALLVATAQVGAVTMMQNKMNQVQQEQNDVEIKLRSSVPDDLKREIDAKMAEMKQDNKESK